MLIYLKEYLKIYLVNEMNVMNFICFFFMCECVLFIDFLIGWFLVIG